MFSFLPCVFKIATFSNNFKSNKTCNVKIGFYCYANDEVSKSYVFCYASASIGTKKVEFGTLQIKCVLIHNVKGIEP